MPFTTPIRLPATPLNDATSASAPVSPKEAVWPLPRLLGDADLPSRIAVRRGIMLGERPSELKSDFQFQLLPSENMVLPLPDHLPAEEIRKLLWNLPHGSSPDTLLTGLIHCGIPENVARGVMAELYRIRLIVPTEAPGRVFALDHGAFSARLEAALRREKVGLTSLASLRSLFDHVACVRTGHEASVPHVEHPVLVVLPGLAFPDVDLLTLLMDHKIPHYASGAVDGNVICGPLVIPGVTPCLACLDAQWEAEDPMWQWTRAAASLPPGRRRSRTGDSVSAPRGSASEVWGPGAPGVLPQAVDSLSADVAALTLAALLVEAVFPELTAAPSRSGSEKLSAIPKKWITHPDSIPPLLRERRMMHIATMTTQVITPQANPDCPACMLARS